MLLITEVQNGVSTVIEESSGKKTTYITGIFAQSEKKNRNGRVYPKEILYNAVDKYNKEYVLQNRAMGEMNHSSSPLVDPERACILIQKLSWDKNDVIGKAKILSTDKGKLLESLINDGVQLGVSTRGLGSLKDGRFQNESVKFACDDYVITAIDVVSSPSGIDCWVNGILEGVEYYYDQGIIKEQEIERCKQHIRKNDVNEILKDFNNFLRKI